jgi:hypothetical protein
MRKKDRRAGFVVSGEFILGKKERQRQVDEGKETRSFFNLERLW